MRREYNYTKISFSIAAYLSKMSSTKNSNVLIIMKSLEMGHNAPRRWFRETTASIGDRLVSRTLSFDLCV